MSQFTNTIIDASLNWVAGTTQTPNAIPVYVSIWNGDPFGAGTEVTANVGAASRPLITFGNVSTGQIASSNNLVTIIASATHANTFNYMGLNSNSTLANSTSTFGSAQIISKTIAIGDGVSCNIGNCTITIAGYPTGTFSNANVVWPLLNWITGTSNTPAITAGRFVGLYTGDPQGAGVECTQNLTNSTTRTTITFTNVISGQIATSNIAANCVVNASNPNTVNYIALHANALTTNTSAILTSVAVTSKAITNNDSWVLPIGNCTITMT